MFVGSDLVPDSDLPGVADRLLLRGLVRLPVAFLRLHRRMYSSHRPTRTWDEAGSHVRAEHGRSEGRLVGKWWRISS